MAWKLRQFFEGDRTITVADVAGSGQCWVNNGNYISGTISININGTDYPLSTASLEAGFLIIPVPNNVYITATTTVQVYSTCVTNPEFTTLTLTAKPVNFQVNSGVIKACNPQVILNSDLDEFVRFYVTDTAGSYFNAKINNANIVLSDFAYQSGDSGNIAVTAGNLSRPSDFGSAASLISTSVYGGTVTLAVTPASTSKYFTSRLGYIEIIFDNGTLLYNNYMESSEFEEDLGTYTTGDILTIEGGSSQYVVRKNGTVLITKDKNISYVVSSGTVVPSVSKVGIPVVWNVPNAAGSYTFTATLGDAITFQKVVKLHSCADAVNDTFTGVYNTPFTGNVSTNDVQCVGENTFFSLTNDPIVGGTINFSENGAFVFTPTPNYNGAASFKYNIRCGTTIVDSEITDTATATVNYFNICNGVVANWQASGSVRCNNCQEEKQEIDLNGQCTGNTIRWVANSGGNACSNSPILVATGEKRCENCTNEMEVQDTNPCSPTHLNKSWIFDVNGSSCDSEPSWVNNGQFRCNNCVEERQQIDNKPCSPTYGSIRWVANLGGTNCNRLPIWTDTNEFTCLNCKEYKIQKDTNSCSPTFNVIRNVDNPGGTSCNTEEIWTDSGVTRCNLGVHEKLQTSTNECSVQSERWVATGLQLCGCMSQIRFTNKCKEGETVVGVSVTKLNTVEANRLVSYSNDVITYTSDIGQHTYLAVITYSTGIKRTIRDLNRKCNPSI